MSSPRRESLPNQPASEAVRAEVARLLDEGLLVALPTETVYGLAARADRPEHLARLRAGKARPDTAPFTWHVGDASALEAFSAAARAAGERDPVDLVVRRLVERYWPGPLTLVLPGVPTGLEHVAYEAWCGVRLPAHAGTASILAALPFPVVLSSANRHGALPCTSADRVAAELGEELALLLDGGETPLGESSTVLRVGRGRFEILREGVIGAEKLRATAGRRIAFVCTGNTCRSPMAEAIARGLIAERLGTGGAGVAAFGFELRSMGVFAAVGAPASEHAVAAVAAMGHPLEAHRSRPALAEDVRAFDHVYCLTAAHEEALRASLPPKRTAMIELLDPEGGDVPDPMGGTRADYDACAARIRALIDRRLAEWV